MIDFILAIIFIVVSFPIWISVSLVWGTLVFLFNIAIMVFALIRGTIASSNDPDTNIGEVFAQAA